MASGGLNRALGHAIFAALGVIAGIGLWFVAGVQQSGAAAPAPAGDPKSAGAEGPAPVAASGPEDCVLHVRTEGGALRSDLAGVSISDLASKQELEVSLEDQRTARFTCPAPELAAEVVFAAGGQLYAVSGIQLGAQHDYVEVEMPSEASELDAVLAKRSEAGLEGAPAWFSEIPALEAPAGEEPGAALAPAPAGEPAPAAGDFTVEVRELSNEVRSKAEIRDVARNRGAEVEACIAEHGGGLPRVRHHLHVAVAPSGAVVASVLLQGMDIPELDACVDQRVASWNYGEAEQASLFKIKMIWKP